MSKRYEDTRPVRALPKQNDPLWAAGFGAVRAVLEYLDFYDAKERTTDEGI